MQAQELTSSTSIAAAASGAASGHCRYWRCVINPKPPDPLKRKPTIYVRYFDFVGDSNFEMTAVYLVMCCYRTGIHAVVVGNVVGQFLRPLLCPRCRPLDWPAYCSAHYSALCSAHYSTHYSAHYSAHDSPTIFFREPIRVLIRVPFPAHRRPLQVVEK